jgi:outer membrane lipoprotein-sorting protein
LVGEGLATSESGEASNIKPASTSRPGERRRIVKLKMRAVARMASMVAFSFIAASVAPSQTVAPNQSAKNAGGPDAAGPTADQIVDKYIEASGGRAAWEKLNSRVSKGTITVPAENVSGPVEIDEKAPNKLRVSVTISGSVFLQGFDGNVGWSEDPQNGLREQTGAELTEVKREADFYHPLDLKKLYATVAVTGMEKVGERTAYVLQATPPGGGNPDRIYFDAQTGLPLRVITRHHNFDGSVEDFQENFRDYRTVDGIKIPFAIEQSDAQVAFSIQLDEVRHNVELKDSEFEKPAAP